MNKEVGTIKKLEQGYPLKILGVGRYLPKRIVTSEELEEKYGAEPAWCEKRIGIRERRFATTESIAFMCMEAIKEACEDANISISQIDYMINAGNSFDQLMPDEAILIMKESTEFRENIGYISINSGCLSFMAAMDLASTIIDIGVYEYIVICSGILASPMVESSNSVERYTVGDGAAAVILTRAQEEESSKVIAARLETYGEHPGVKGFLTTDGSDVNILFNKYILSQGISYEFDTKQMQSEGMRYNKDFLSRLLPCGRKNIAKVIPNQASRIASDMLKIMFPAHKIKTIIERFGNIGAAGQPMALYEVIKDGEINRGDCILLQAMGAGFSIYGMLLIY